MSKFKPWEYVGDTTVRVAGGPTKNPKKLTGTRLGAVLGLNKWKSPFGAWCEMCRVAEEPFEDNKFTLAGKAIEPKLIAWCKENLSPYVYTPYEWFGKTTQDMGYDHFPDQPILGGMWDAIVLDGPLGKGKPIGVVECKTSSRPQDWGNDDEAVPDSYGVQGLAYAHLLGVDRAFFPVAFLSDEDYEHPEDFECTDRNTFLYELNTSTLIEQRTIAQSIEYALDWWNLHVKSNESPAFDEKRDKTYLAIMRKSEVKSDSLEAMAKEASVLEAKIETLVAKTPELNELTKQLTALKKKLKPAIIETFKPNDETVVAYGWKVKKTEEAYIDKEAMEADEVLDKYTKVRDKFTLTKEK